MSVTIGTSTRHQPKSPSTPRASYHETSAREEDEPGGDLSSPDAPEIEMERKPGRRERPNWVAAAVVSLVVALPFGVIAGIVLVATSGCPSYLSIIPAWARSLAMGVILALFLVFGPCIGIIVACNPRRCNRCCPCTRQGCVYFGGLLTVVAAVLLVVPATGEPYMRSVGMRSLTGLGADWTPPSGYCAQAAVQTEWFAGFDGLTPYSPAFEARLGWLMGNLTGEEKVRLLQGVGWDWPYPPTDFYSGSVPAVPRLGIPSLHMSDAGQGWRTTHRSMVGRVTSFPSGLAAAATWDAEAVQGYAAAIGVEFRAKGANAVLGPTADLVRSPWGGRAPETLAGEEPYLGAAMVGAYVRGLRSVGVAAVVKHYSFNSQEFGRMGAVSMDAGRRAAMEAHYVPVRAAVGAGASATMCAYNLVNGTQSCGADWLLRRDLIGALGFDGFVVSDWFAIYDAKLAARAPVHMNMPGVDGAFSCPGMLSDAQRDAKVEAVLRGMLKTLDGMQSPPCILGCDCLPLLHEANATSDAHVATARRVAAGAAVLLKNTDEVLPIAPGAIVAVVGAACDAHHSFAALNAGSQMDSWNRGDYYVVGGSGRVVSDRAASVLAGLRAHAASHGLTLRTSPTDDVAAALMAMQGASVAIACGGSVGQEAEDRTSLELDQHAFLSRLAVAANVPLAVVAFAAGPLVVGEWSAAASAALGVFLSGQETGHAVAELLLGDTAPSGRLPVTFYATAEQVDPRVRICSSSPCVLAEGVHVGWRALESVAVAFPFGHGLSYTRFNYSFASAPTLAYEAGGVRPRVDLEVSVRNVGTRAAREVVQLYLRNAEPLTTLRLFEKTRELPPGEVATVVFSLPPDAFDVFDYALGAMAPVRPLAEHTLLVGASSRDIRLEYALS